MKNPKLPILTEAQVRERLAVCKDKPEVIDQLYDFGNMLLSDAIGRIATMDSKAASLAAYAGGIITLLVSTAKLWASTADKFATSLIVLASVAALFAGACAMHSVTLQTIDWFSSDEWMQKDQIGERNKLRRYHVLAMWSVIESHQARSRSKIKRVRLAETFLAAAGLLLAASFFEIAVKQSSLKSLISQGWQIVGRRL